MDQTPEYIVCLIVDELDKEIQQAIWDWPRILELTNDLRELLKAELEVEEPLPGDDGSVIDPNR